jgi:hypothetical protein
MAAIGGISGPVDHALQQHVIAAKTHVFAANTSHATAASIPASTHHRHRLFAAGTKDA